MVRHNQIFALIDLLVNDILKQISIDRIKTRKRLVKNKKLRVRNKSCNFA